MLMTSSPYGRYGAVFCFFFFVHLEKDLYFSIFDVFVVNHEGNYFLDIYVKNKIGKIRKNAFSEMLDTIFSYAESHQETL